MKATFKALVAAGAMTLAGCAQQPEQPPAEPVAQTPSTPEPAPPPPRPFTSDTLYALLSAEIAGSRGRFDVALANYSQQAQQTGDPQVAERAYRIARYLEDEDTALRMAQIWADSDRANTDAQAAAILAFIEADRLVEAFDATQKGTTRDSGALLQSIAANAKQVTDTQREQLLGQYQSLLEREPDNVPLLIGTGLLLQQQGRIQQALDLAQRAKTQAPDNTHALVLASGLLHQLERGDEAIASVERYLEGDPDDTRARLQYARLLTFRDLEAAQAQFQQLVDANPRDGDMLRALALVAEERGDSETAERAYYALLDMDQQSDAAHYYLGQLAERREQPDEAIKHYQQVEPGENFLPAIARVFAINLAQGNTASAENQYQRLHSQLPESERYRLTLVYKQTLMDAGLEDRALQLLNEQLEQQPQNSDLLYARSMAYTQRDNHSAAEQDLRRILQYDPGNAAALNALGYVLTEHTERYSEAYELIKQALELQPEDPATIDSMGWVQYHLGNTEIALRYLRRAMSLHPDHEIAAHLGEVLWASDQPEQAKQAWRRGLELQPDSDYILQTLERLNVDPESL